MDRKPIDIINSRPLNWFKELDQYILAPNLQIHREAKMDKREFLHRLRVVKALRTMGLDYQNGVCFYITSEDDIEQWRVLHQSVQTGSPTHGPFWDKDGYLFAVLVPPMLHQWLAANRFETVLRHIYLFLAVLYCASPRGKRRIMESQLYPLVLKNVLNLYETYLVPREPRIAPGREITPLHEDFDSEDLARIRHESSGRDNIYIDGDGIFLEWYDDENGPLWGEIYDEVALECIGSLPPPFRTFSAPGPGWRKKQAKPGLAEAWGFSNAGYFAVSIAIAYMRNDDWERVVVKEKEDDLIRSDSDQLVYQQWYVAYITDGDVNDSLARTNKQKGLIYIVQAGDSCRFKIGYTRGKSPDSRLSSLQTGSPDQLILRGFFPAPGPEYERALHGIFATKRLAGEWFYLDAREVDQILNDDWRQQHGLY